MKRLHYFLLLACLSSFSKPIFSQHRNAARLFAVEAGLGAGFANYSGDLSGKLIVFRENRFGYGAFAKVHLTPDFGIRFNFLQTMLTGDDRKFAKNAYRKFKFSTNVSEFSMTAEWQALHFSQFADRNFFLSKMSAYVFGGGGLAFVRPVAKCYGLREDCDLNAPFGFPEPDLPSRLPVAQAGGGLLFFDDFRTTWRAEVGLRSVFSDLLDGISQNASVRSNDYFFFAGISTGIFLSSPHRVGRYLH